MSELLKATIFGCSSFIIIFLVYYFGFLLKRYNLYNGKTKVKKKKRKKQSNPLDFMEFTYLTSRFNLDVNKINVLYCFRWIAVLDAFIISFIGTVVYYIPWNIVWKFLIGFVMIFCLIYSLYEIFGRHLIKKGWNKNE